MSQNSATNAYRCASDVNNNNKNNNNAVVVAYAYHCIDEHVTLEEVEQAYYECRRNKRNSEGAIRYEQRYELNNLKLWITDLRVTGYT